jgi:hypothetical protein
MWLRGLSPITIPLPILEKTIQSHFSVFSTVKLASHFELIGGSLVATVLNSGLKTPRK